MSDFDFGYDAGSVDRSEGSELIPGGIYLCSIERLKTQEPTEDKGPQLMVAFKVVDTDTKDNEQYVGAEFADFMSLKKTAIFRVLGLVDAVTGQRFTGSKINFEEKLLGKRVVVKVKQEEYQGNKRSRCDRFYPTAKWRKQNAKPAEAKAAPSGEEEVTL